jgi:hypothetical protein
MEALIAALVGWISTEDAIINIQTGLRIVNVTEHDDKPAAEIFYPDGTSEVYEGKDAEAIFDRSDQLSAAGNVLIEQLNKLTQGVPQQ